MGPKKTEMVNRLNNEGIPADEATAVLQEVRLEEFQEQEALSARQRFEDPRAQRLSDSWHTLGEEATVEQKDLVAKAHLRHVLGLSNDLAEGFFEHEPAAWEEAGLRNAGVVTRESNYERYWRTVGDIFPDSLTEEDIIFLAEEGGYEAERHLRAQLEGAGVPSNALYQLIANAHVYK